MTQALGAQLATEVLRGVEQGIAPAYTTALIFTQLAVEVARYTAPNGSATQLAVEVIHSFDSGIEPPPGSLFASQLTLEVLAHPAPLMLAAQLAGEVIHSLDSGIEPPPGSLFASQLTLEVLRYPQPHGIAGQLAIEVISSPDLCNCVIVFDAPPGNYLLRRPLLDRVMHRLLTF